MELDAVAIVQLFSYGTRADMRFSKTFAVVAREFFSDTSTHKTVRVGKRLNLADTVDVTRETSVVPAAFGSLLLCLFTYFKLHSFTLESRGRRAKWYAIPRVNCSRLWIDL